MGFLNDTNTIYIQQREIFLQVEDVASTQKSEGVLNDTNMIDNNPRATNLHMWKMLLWPRNQEAS